MEDLPIKAIVIGVSAFVTMAVLSAILLYFNTAKEIAYEVQDRTDIADIYDRVMNEDNFETMLTGVEIRSLIIKYVGNENINISIVEISGQNPNDYKQGEYRNINNSASWVNTINDVKIIKESKLDIINPIWKCKVDKVKEQDKITLNLKLNVEK